MELEIEKRGPGRPPKNDRATEMRPPMQMSAQRYDESAEMARADELARKIRDNQTGLDSSVGGEFDIPAHWIPPGWTYEWKRKETAGKEDHENIMTAHRGGWQPVPASRHPELCPVGFAGDSIIKGGLILMERPAVITQQARIRDNAEARRAMLDKERQLGYGAPGTIMGRDDARVTPRVDSVFRPAEIPAK